MTECFTGQSGAAWRYWTDQPLGEPGEFGAVYAAEASDGTPMAVKVVRKRGELGMLGDRLLLREVEIGRKVAESRAEMLLPVVDTADAGEVLLLVMARADGALADAAKPMEESQVVAVMTDIATGLVELQEIAVIHRDLKPANVLRHDGRWKLADFGIARDAEIGTQSDTFVGWGSPPYMAPESWDGKRPTVKMDLYALGCLGFELLDGRPPYRGDRAAIRQGHSSQDIPLVPSGNVVLRNLIIRLLAKNHDDRPKDAREVLERLRRAPSPLTPELEAIAAGLAQHAAEKSHVVAGQAAERAAASAAAVTHGQRIALARQELRGTVQEAFAGLRTIEPGAMLDERVIPLVHSDLSHYYDYDAQKDGLSDGRSPEEPTAGPSIFLSTPDAVLRIDIWKAGRYWKFPFRGDELVTACCVHVANRRNSAGRDIANLVYGKVGGRLMWQAYRFDAGKPVSRSRITITRHSLRSCGLRYYDFGSSGKLEISIKSITEFTAESLLQMFREAVELQTPRAGYW